MPPRTRRSPLARAASATAAALLAATGLLTGGGTAHAAAPDTLPNGGTLAPGASLASGDTRLVMRPDGDLALYTTGTDGTEDQRPRWHSGTTGEGNRAELRPDGDLVVTSPDGGTLWRSRTGDGDCAHLPWTKLTVRPGGDMSILATTNSEAPYFVRLWSASYGPQFPCTPSPR
ncbi:hypothetical protein [Streptomyces caatingaensis]|uniref:Bulb-type lectin domain-containing protein n=1 Tax=Streptomyces caatingaensis TaxID=1678637 RepID=A0A0K9XMD9_9ACTN|nr:hypothetical protein [Streptomyces caatingaensis]KNB53872.1 hypothetical protein AC230_04615 [Streptomyces caatingaensis]